MTDIATWRDATIVNPHNALAFFNVGVSNQKAKKWNAAIAAYNKVVELKSPLSPAANYYKALIYNEHGRADLAQKLIVSLSHENLPPNLKQLVLSLKHHIFAEPDIALVDPNLETETKKNRPPIEKKKVSGFIDLSAGNNSDPFADSSSPTIGGAPDTTEQVKAGADFLISAAADSEFRFDYNFSSNFYSKSTDANYFYHQLTAPFSYYFWAYRIKLTPIYQLDNYGGHVYSDSYGGSLDFAKHINNSYCGVNIQATAIKNKTTTDSYLSGGQNRFQVYFEFRTRVSRLMLTGALNQLSYEDTPALASSYISYPLTIAYTRYLRSAELTLSVGDEPKIYSKATPASVARSDNRVSFNIHAGYFFTRWYQLYADFTSIQNSSNFNSSAPANFNYYQNISVAGLIANF